MEKAYYKPQNRLVFFGEEANDQFWDTLWSKNKNPLQKNNFVKKYTKKYLKPNTKILEGGCGRGDVVYTLHNENYNIIGIDYAKETVDQVNTNYPELAIKIGDVRKLDFNDNEFDGYWSLGVIEHFQEGYDHIANEMYRVIKPNGFLFLTVPCFSWIRKVKAFFGLYPQSKNDEKNFYQFAISPEEIIQSYEKLGFKLLKYKKMDGTKGLKDEIPFLKPILQPVYDSTFFPVKVIRRLINITTTWFSNHAALYVLRKD